LSASVHPYETTLLDYARGALKPGARVVVASHLETCAVCAADVHALEAAAGCLIDGLVPAELQDHALEMILASIERPIPAPAPLAPLAASSLLRDVDAPAALRRADIGPARWMAPGVRVAKLRGVGEGEMAYLLRVAPGMRMPDHGHRGAELTLVLKGSFSDHMGHYRVGDLAEVGEDNEHSPTVGADEDCVCLVAAQGVMRMKEWLPRVLQPLFGV
jgi:putative transcriptional regulator